MSRLLQHCYKSTSSRFISTKFNPISSSLFNISNKNDILNYSLYKNYHVTSKIHTQRNNLKFNRAFHVSSQFSKSNNTNADGITNNINPSSSSVPPPLPYKVGEMVHGFQLKSVENIEDYNLILYEFNHLSSNSLYYHLSRSDPDNSFSIGFNTHPYSSNGICHILEHVALCGSKQFPVRDPFFLLNRRSLKTYMNAMTASDYTMYPFSTQNIQDYNNLLQVYLDSAFFPLLRKLDFLQEGHRIEIKNKNKKSNNNEEEDEMDENNNNNSNADDIEIQFKGVVYNEMKGAMSDNNSLFSQRFQTAIFNDNSNVYYHNSGGEPSEITDLTHEELVKFHKQNYQPANALFLSYGDKPPPLEIVNNSVLKHFQTANTDNKSAPKPQYKPIAARNSTTRLEFTCPPDPVIAEEDKQYKIAINYVCNDLFDPNPKQSGNSELEVDLFSMHVLSSLLLDGPSSPLYQALIEPNLGSSYAPGTGFDTSTRQPTFTFGLTNCDQKNYDLILNTIQSTLERVSKEGFNPERIEAILHQLELSLKHVRTGFGIGIVMRLNSLWAHDKSVSNALRVNERINKFKAKLVADPQYLQKLLTKHVLNNKHITIATMKPDPEYTNKENQAELQKLRQVQAKLTENDKQHLIEQAKQLKQSQETKSDPTILPSLTIDNIKKNAELVEFQPLQLNNTLNANIKNNEDSKQLQFLSQPTNGCVYYRGLINLSELPLDLYPYLGLYTSFLSEMGTKNINYRELSHQIDLYTGGLGASVKIHSGLDNLEGFFEYLLFKGTSLKRNFDKLLNLSADVINFPDFGNLDRLSQLINQTAAGASTSLQDSGNVFAKLDAASRYGYTSSVGEILGGITFVQFINKLQADIVAAYDKNNDPNNNLVLKAISGKLKSIQSYVNSRGLEKFLAVGEEQSKPLFKQSLNQLFSTVPLSNDHITSNDPIMSKKGFQPEIDVSKLQATANSLSEEGDIRRRFFLLPISVNYVAYVIPTGVYYTHPDAPVFDVLTRLLSNCYLHREIREIGGAYGSGAGHSSEGLLYMSTYRDPNPENSVKILQSGAYEWLSNIDNYSSNDLEEALLNLFSSIDSPTPPSGKGSSQFLMGITYEQRQDYRNKLLKVSREDIKRVGEKYFNPQSIHARLASISIVGDQTKVPQAFQDDQKWEKIQLE